jgi:hypothetical protein
MHRKVSAKKKTDRRKSRGASIHRGGTRELTWTEGKKERWTEGNGARNQEHPPLYQDKVN